MVLKLDVPGLVVAYEAGRSASDLARQHGVSVWTVLSRLRKAGVAVRRNQNERRLDLAPDQHSAFLCLVDGLLLGDGWIDPKGSLRLEQCRRRKGWIDQVRAQLSELGAECKIIPIPPRTREIQGRTVRSGGGHLLYTPCYVETQAQRLRWYPDGQKRVPHDVSLPPMALAHWLAGDGTGGAQGYITFCTNGFVREDVELLVEKLCCMGLGSVIEPQSRWGEYNVRVNTKLDAVRFKELVFPHLAKCCHYKLRHVRLPVRLGRFSDEQIREIRHLFATGASKASLARAFGVSDAAIYNIVNRKVYRNL